MENANKPKDTIVYIQKSKKLYIYIYIYIYTTFQKKVRKLDLLEA